jgi:WD40 repeat protein
MRIPRLFIIAFFSVFALVVAPRVPAQQSCPPPPVPTNRGTNIFDAQQEMILGEVEAEHLQRDFRVIDDPELTAYLQRVGDRLVRHMPQSSMKFQFVLYDQPRANAFGLSGGLIYVSRKLVAFMKSEDELAGLLGHELGHLAGHHTATDMSTYFRVVLGVTSVTDRKDIFDKYNQLLDNFKKKPSVFQEASRHEEPDQLVADNLGLYLASTSGYDPRALTQFWDRFAETRGKTGGFFSDLFGTTKPDEKRLRELERGIASIPGPCGDTPSAPAPADFAAWRTAVLNYTGLGHRESLHSVVLRRPLEPPLRGDTRFLRFSPDGKYLLAQDDSSIHILTREPFAPVFRIDAPDAHEAQFSADSQTISFYTSALRVETWNIVDQERTALQEMVVKNGCFQTELSPDGRFLACYGFGESTFNLRVFSTATAAPVFEKKSFYQPNTIHEFLLVIEGWVSEGVLSRIVTMRFSPDSHYFVASSHDETVEALDLITMKPISLPGAVKKLLVREFEFMAPDKIAGINVSNPEKSAIVSFPDGKMIEELSLGTRDFEPVARGNYLLLRPIKDYAVGVLDITTKKIFMADKEPAFDIFDTVAAVQRLDGGISLKQVSNNQEIAKLTLPRGPLAPLRAVALSSDLNWLAVSERSRGAVWDLAKNERLLNVRGFLGAYIGPDGTLYADFPKFQETARSVAQINLASKSATVAYKVDEDSVHQYGAFLVNRKPNKEGGSRRENITVEVRDSSSGKPLWSRSFPHEAPGIFIDPGNGTIALTWALAAKSAKDEISANQDLSARAQGVKKDETNLLVEVLDARSGKYQGGVIVDTNKGSFLVRDVFAAGSNVLVGDNENRILIYSLATGEQTGKGFGHAAQVSANSGLVAVENEAGQVLLCDLVTMQKRDEFRFSSPVSMKRFSDDGKRLFVLTASQVAYVIDISSATQPAAKSAAVVH